MSDIIEERLKEALIERETPTVIHCKDCAHHFGKFCWCSELRCYMEDDDFCSKAERKNA